ncbi:MAG: hypothetical protein RI928_1848 [Pseudomonadota bacterium]|jgi:uncharacterized sporulation protein YeaH/YhbH (DUF444 family)
MAIHSTISTGSSWYALFSRGARDWLRHNEKIRQSIKKHLPELIANSDLMTSPDERTVHLPVHAMEHARFRLADPTNEILRKVGQGHVNPGDVLRSAPEKSMRGDETGGANGEGEVRLMLELKMDDVVDWLWEELNLPDLKLKQKTAILDEAWLKEGWDKHGARARLDRRRTVKEAVKRRAIQRDPLPFSSEDLRFRQLIHRRRPATQAVVLFLLDVSASMTDAERKLAKTFFFFALQGIRRRYGRIDTRFIAHTTQAWEFSEMDFFQVTGTGGTGASSGFNFALRMIDEDYAFSQFNVYLFYASDGENFTEDRSAATDSLKKLSSLLNYVGYVETVPGAARINETEMKMICNQIEKTGTPLGSYVLNKSDDVWKAIRHFFASDKQQNEWL